MNLKRNFIRISLMVSCLGLATNGLRAADSSSSSASADPITDWSQIQAAGGIQIGTALQSSASTWKLPLQCDMSKNAPGTLIEKTIVKQEGINIYISLVLTHTVWTLTPERSLCKELTIDSLPGVFLVSYRDAAGTITKIGYVEFKEANRGAGG